MKIKQNVPNNYLACSPDCATCKPQKYACFGTGECCRNRRESRLTLRSDRGENDPSVSGTSDDVESLVQMSTEQVATSIFNAAATRVR
jgi:hypothetical protein